MRAGQRCGCPALLGGGDLLSHFRSTIGAVRFNFSVRNGKRWSPHAITTLVLSSPPVWCVKVRSSIGSASFLSLCLDRALFAFLFAPDFVFVISAPGFAPLMAALRGCSQPDLAAGCGALARKAIGILVLLGWDIAALAPATYLRRSLQRPSGRSYLGEGFVLRCFQHLSLPDADTRQCTWRYNR